MRCPGQFFREEGNKRQQEGKNVTQKERNPLFIRKNHLNLIYVKMEFF